MRKLIAALAVLGLAGAAQAGLINPKQAISDSRVSDLDAAGCNMGPSVNQTQGGTLIRLSDDASASGGSGGRTLDCTARGFQLQDARLEAYGGVMYESRDFYNNTNPAGINYGPWGDSRTWFVLDPVHTLTGVDPITGADLYAGGACPLGVGLCGGTIYLDVDNDPEFNTRFILPASSWPEDALGEGVTRVLMAYDPLGVNQVYGSAPGTDYIDSDTDDADVSVRTKVDCTGTGSGAEDCDYTISTQQNGTMTDAITIDGDYSSSGVSETVIGTGMLRIPNGTGPPAVNLAGRMAIDTSAGGSQLIYGGNANAVQVIDPVRTSCTNVASIGAASDNVPIFITDRAITIQKTAAYCTGTCSGTLAQFLLEDQAGNAVTGTTVASATTTTATWTAVTAGGSIAANEIVRFDTTNTPTDTDTYTICFTYTTDRI